MEYLLFNFLRIYAYAEEGIVVDGGIVGTEITERHHKLVDGLSVVGFPMDETEFTRCISDMNIEGNEQF